ncbi:MAG: arginine--tRNA ligase [Bacilli bacterium]|nr:arginine--tRNA ligase [Bacilli bacterium]
MDIKKYISDKICEMFNVDSVVIERPPKDEMGDFSLQCASLRNEALKSPFDVANYIKENFLDDEKIFNELKVMGPYINFYLNYELLACKVINEVESKLDKYGSNNQGRGEGLLIEHTSINPNAEPHMGRCRNSLIGDFVSNLFKFTGYDVERHYFINDLGKKIALLVLGIEKYGLNGNDFKDILDVYVKISREAKDDLSIEQMAFDYLERVENGDSLMIEKFKSITDKCVSGQMKIFSELNISFDKFTHESDYVYGHYLNDILDKLREKNKLREDENGRYYVDLEGYDIPTREPVLVLTRSNKTSLYPIKDIAYSIYKIGLNSKNNYIVLGEDQEVYMKQISAVLDILGYSSPKLISYSYVLLDGEKMSTSNGTLVLVSDFMRELRSILKSEFEKRSLEVDDEKLNILANACVKFTMLNVSKNKIVNFNIENATSFAGESGIYILYSLVRINSILNNNCDIEKVDDIRFTTDIEKKLIRDLYDFNSVVDSLLNTLEPAHLTKYIFNLTQDFSRFYEEINISNEKDIVLKSSRLRLLECVKVTLTNALGVLGISTIDKM